MARSIVDRIKFCVGDNVLLEWESAGDFYGRTGLARPDSYKDVHYTGRVLAIGLDCRADEKGNPILNLGDRVFFDRFNSPDEFDTRNLYWEEDGKRYCFLREPKIYAVVPAREEFEKEYANAR